MALGGGRLIHLAAAARPLGNEARYTVADLFPFPITLAGEKLPVNFRISWSLNSGTSIAAVTPVLLPSKFQRYKRLVPPDWENKERKKYGQRMAEQELINHIPAAAASTELGPGDELFCLDKQRPISMRRRWRRTRTGASC